MNRRGFFGFLAGAAAAPVLPAIPAPIITPANAGTGLRIYGGPTLPPMHFNCRCSTIFENRGPVSVKVNGRVVGVGHSLILEILPGGTIQL